MKKKSWIVYLMIFSLVAAMLTGCDKSPEEVDMTIDPEMTGYEDFATGAYEGETYVIAYGSGGSDTNSLQLQAFAEYLRSVMNYIPAEQLTIKVDTEVTDEDIKKSHLILLGNPTTNTLFTRVNEQLPIQVTAGRIVVSDIDWFDDTGSAMFISLVPNPLNRTKYLLVYGALEAESFSELRNMTMHVRNEEYLIKTDARTRYSGTFSKSATDWTIPAIVEKKTVEDFETIESEHFVVRIDPADKGTMDQIDEIMKRREVSYREFASVLGFEPETPIEIDIFMTEGIMEHYVGRDDDTGNGIIYEVHNQGMEDPEYKRKIARVFLGTVAAPLDQMVRDGFVNELSSSIIYLLSSVHPNEFMWEILESESVVSLHAVTGARIDPDLDSEIVQEELRSFTHYLIEGYGLDKTIELYAENANERVEAAIQTVYGKELDELEDEWLRTIK